MIARIWTTGLDGRRTAAYERFAYERSLPMFQRRPGCLGVFFARVAGGRAVITLWSDIDAVSALEAAPEYQATVDAIHVAGFLRPPQTVETFTVGGGWVAPELATRLGEPGS